eukprot:3121377-Rhodomonas_salina.4
MTSFGPGRQPRCPLHCALQCALTERRLPHPSARSTATQTIKSNTPNGLSHPGSTKPVITGMMSSSRPLILPPGLRLSGDREPLLTQSQ